MSHDRYFINQTATRILELVNRKFVNYIGNYDYYLEKKEELTAAYASPATAKAGKAASAEPVSEAKQSWQEQKEAQARERKRQNDLKKTEERITCLEERDARIDELMATEEVYTNSIKCQELAQEKADIAAQLEELYEKWRNLRKAGSSHFCERACLQYFFLLKIRMQTIMTIRLSTMTPGYPFSAPACSESSCRTSR